MAASVVFYCGEVLMANEPPVFKALNLLLARRLNQVYPKLII
jgi:hypothetical protein